MKTSIKHTPALPVLLSAVLSLGVSAQAAIISVNQVDSLTDSTGLIGPTSAAESGALAGAPGYNVGYWNESVQATFAGTLLDSNGSAVSGLTVVLGGGGSNNNWSVTNWPGGNDKNLRWGSLQDGVTVTGIPFASYDLVIYSLPDSILFGPQTSSVTLTIGTTTTTVNQAWVQGQGPNTFITYDVAGNPGGTFSADNANTIIFKGLTDPDISFTGRGNGFQIVEGAAVPEGSSSLMFMASLGVLVARRRRSPYNKHVTTP